MQSHDDPDRLYNEAKDTFKVLNASNQSAMEGFADFIHGVEKDGALSAKMKQIITVSISVIKQCKWCIVYHTRKALQKGATKEELMEACFTASLMGGGPSMMYSRLVIEEIDRFENDGKSEKI